MIPYNAFMRRFFLSRLLSLLPLFTLLSLTVLIHGPLLTKPFYGHHDWVSVLYGQIARNNLRYGLLVTHFGQVTTAGVTNPSQFDYHTHHPLLWPLLLTLSAATLGLHEWSIRLVPFLSSLGAMSVYYLLVKRHFGALVAFFSGLFFLATPMFLYFGVLPDKEPFVLFLILLTLRAYLRSDLEGPKGLTLLILFLLGGLTHWIFYLLPIVFFLHQLIVRRKPKQSLFLLFTFYFLLLATLAFHLWHTHLLTGDYLGGGLKETLSFRLSSTASDKTNFTVIEYISKLFARLGNYFGWIVLPFVSIGLLTLVTWRIQRRGESWLDSRTPASFSLIFLFLAIGLLYPIVFRNYVYIHDYLLYYLLPFWGLSVTLGIMAAVRFLKTRLILPFPLSLLTLFSLFTLLTLTLVDRAPIIITLRRSDWYQRGKHYGAEIALHSLPTQKVVFVSSVEDAETLARFIDFYADRHVIYLPNLSKSELESYDVVALPSHWSETVEIKKHLGNFKQIGTGSAQIYSR